MGLLLYSKSIRALNQWELHKLEVYEPNKPLTYHMQTQGMALNHNITLVSDSNLHLVCFH